MRLLVFAVLFSVALVPQAQTLRHASNGDPQTMDPHAVALLINYRVCTQIYESLINRDEAFRVEPALAIRWEPLDGARRWRFWLRPGVSFHDGSPFVADDAVFSIKRALGSTSGRRFQLDGITAIQKVDDLTIDVVLAAPDAVLPEKLDQIGMMNRTWSVKHGVERSQDYNAKQETFAARHANGTGPYMLERYEADKITVLLRNPKWWGQQDKRHGNVERLEYHVITSDATRLAALESGEIDLVIDVPFQDVARLKRDKRLAVLQTQSISTVYFTFDQYREALLRSDLRGRNPFKDRRVRLAVYHALNADLIVEKVYRGNGEPTGSLFSPLVDGYRPDLEQRRRFDPSLARKLLAEAGYPNGFSVILSCLNSKAAESLCQAAAAMLTQVGIRTQVEVAPSAIYFPRLQKFELSLLSFGWYPNPDPWDSLNALFRTADERSAGSWNAGRYSSQRVDSLIDAVRTEPDPARRREQVGEALAQVHEDVAFIPILRPLLSWAVRKGVRVTQWPSNMVEARFVKIVQPKH